MKKLNHELSRFLPFSAKIGVIQAFSKRNVASIANSLNEDLPELMSDMSTKSIKDDLVSEFPELMAPAYVDYMQREPAFELTSNQLFEVTSGILTSLSGKEVMYRESVLNDLYHTHFNAGVSGEVDAQLRELTDERRFAAEEFLRTTMTQE